MTSKIVSFSEASSNSESFQTWPHTILKSKIENNDPQLKHNDMKSQVIDLYNRFLSPHMVDKTQIGKFLIENEFEDPLISYSVLNWLLKATFEGNVVDPDNIIELNLTADDACNLMLRAQKDLQTLNQSNDVIQSRAIPQIIRLMESVWSKISEQESMYENCKDAMAVFAVCCIDIIGTKYNSKATMNSILRICGYAVERNLYTGSNCEDMVINICKTSLTTGANFQSELSTLFNVIYKIYPSAIVNTEKSWIPTAIKCAASYHQQVRTNSMDLLQTIKSEESFAYIARCLEEPSDKRNLNSEELGRVISKKLMSLLIIPADESRSLIGLWSLILQSSMKCTNLSTSEGYGESKVTWKYLDYWQGLLRLAFKYNLKSASETWGLLLNAQSQNSSYQRLLADPIATAPLHVQPQTSLTLNKVLKDALNHSNPNTADYWPEFLKPAIEQLLQRSKESSAMSSYAIQIWRQAIQKGLKSHEKYAEDYIEFMTKLFRPNNITANNIWASVISSFKTRNLTMELIRFHYKYLSQESTASLHSWNPTALFVNNMDFTFLAERHKNHNYSLLTLLLLPVVTFINEDNQTKYLERLVLSKPRSSFEKNKILEALVATLTATQENLETKWLSIANTIAKINVSGGNGKVLVDLMLLFPTSASSDDLWEMWAQIFAKLNVQEGQLILSKITSLRSLAAFKTIAGIDGYADYRCKLICGVLKKETCVLFKNHANNTQFVDLCAKNLINRGQVEKVELALNLISEQRMFVIARYLLDALHLFAASSNIVNVWNGKIVPSLIGCPAFISEPQAKELTSKYPNMNVPRTLIILAQDNVNNNKDNNNITNETNESTSTSNSASSPPPNKRRRRGILTGSAPLSTSIDMTPPASNDYNSDDSRTQTDDLCSSPPPPNKTSQMDSKSNTIGPIRTTQDRVRMLKRALLGLDMEDAAQYMKRPEKEMIYNLMFRSCLWLKTNLSETAETISNEELTTAKTELESAREKSIALNIREAEMVENQKKRAFLDQSSSPDVSDEDDEIPYDFEIKTEM